MDPEFFKSTLKNSQPDPTSSVWLQALWYDATGNWQKAHELIQDLPDRVSALLHAYLHRKEGDMWNADYWYKKAGSQRPDISLQEEWEHLVKSV